MEYLCEGKSGAGLIRAMNQDNLYANGRMRADPHDAALFSCSDISGQGLYAVCDGMGGEQLGEEASLIGVSRLAGTDPRNFPEMADEILRSANAEICRLMRGRGNVRIGTTFVALSIADDRAHAVNIGDSRCYIHRDGKLEQLSRDHTQTQRLIDMGLLNKEAVRRHPDRHKLTQHLGIFPEEMIIEPYLSGAIEVLENDLFLLCSDGLTDMLTDEQIRAALDTDGSVSSKVERLYELAMRNGGKDNITIVLVQARKWLYHRRAVKK